VAEDKRKKRSVGGFSFSYSCIKEKIGGYDCLEKGKDKYEGGVTLFFFTRSEGGGT